MLSETLSFSPPPPHKSLELLKERFKQRLNAILFKPLTVDNIETFADEALNETVKLNDEILREYSRNPNFHASPTTLNTQEQEKHAYKILGLPDISEILESISKIIDEIKILKEYLGQNTEHIHRLITPSQPNTTLKNEKGEGELTKKEIFPRLLTLLYILKHDFNIDPSPENIPIKEGIVTTNMFRKAPYARVEISALQRVAYVCEEDGNVTYIFDTEKIREIGLSIEQIDLADKLKRDSLVASHPGIGIRLRQSVHWRERVATALEMPIPEIQTEKKDTGMVKRKSEFTQRERRNFLSFDEFQTEVITWWSSVKVLYKNTNDINIQKLYLKEKEKHENWPVVPQKVYRNKGWEGWPKLIEKYLPFDKFQEEVRNLYPGGVNIGKWYQDEARNHPEWPRSPHVTYKNRGWINWKELVEKYLSLDKLRSEVMPLYPGKGYIREWYLQEKKTGKHQKWPVNPDIYYRGRGWVSWPMLVGK